MPKTTSGGCPEFKPVNVRAAAIDIGSKMHVAAVDPACTDTPVRAFGTFTQDLPPFLVSLPTQMSADFLPRKCSV